MSDIDEALKAEKLKGKTQALQANIEKAQNRPPRKSLQQCLDDWKEHHFPKLVALAKNKDEAERIYVICLNTISRNPKLLECTPASLMGCIMQSFQLKLFPGPFQQCAYVPYYSSKNKVTEAQFQPQYQGLVDLMMRAGCRIVNARVVREGDQFVFHEVNRAPDYVPAAVLGKESGKVKFTYCAVSLPSGLWKVEVMSEKQMDALKSRSKPVQKGYDTPWTSEYEDDVDAMRCKSIAKRISKWCPKSTELVTALEADNFIEGDETFEKEKIIDLNSSSSPAPVVQMLDAPNQREELNFGGIQEDLDKIEVDFNNPESLGEMQDG